jgi:hypothetical protein
MNPLASLIRQRKRPHRPQALRRRPQLERLEAREVPSAAQQFSSFADQLTLARSLAPVPGQPPPAPFNVNTDTVDQISNETSIAVNPTNPNNLIGSANNYQLTIDPRTGAIKETLLSSAHVSFDGGATWSNFQIPSLKYTVTGDPGVSFDANGTAFASFLGSGLAPTPYPDLWATTSTDGGKTWTQHPVVVAHNVTNADGSGIFNDKPYIFAWGNGNAIITYTQLNLLPGGNAASSNPIFASVTHDAGKNWSTPVNISGPINFDQGSNPTMAADGSIYVSFFGTQFLPPTEVRDHVRVVKVDPATGNPLGDPVTVGLMFDNVGVDFPLNADGGGTLQESQFRQDLLIGNIAADPTNPLHLAVCWSDCRNGLPTSSNPYATTTNSDIIVSQSFDGGITWLQQPRAIELPNDQFQPWAAYDATGHLNVGFFDRQYDTTTTSFVPGAPAGNHLYGYTLATEMKPGNLNWAFRQITTALSDPTKGDAWFRRNVSPNFPNATGFLGDYSNIAITPTGVAAFWTDLRDPSTFPGRVGLHTEESFFGDPSSGASNAALASAVASSTTKSSLPASASIRSDHLDGFFASLSASGSMNADHPSPASSSISLSANQTDSSSADLLALLGLRLGLGDDNLDPLA